MPTSRAALQLPRILALDLPDPRVLASHMPKVSHARCEAGMLASIVNLRQVLNNLINLMVHKKIITEDEAARLSRQMFR